MKQSTYSLEAIDIFLDENVYSKEAIFKTLYWYGNRFITIVNHLSDRCFHVHLEPLTDISLEEIKSAYENLNRDLLDFQLRQIIHNETKNLRDLIVAKAFADGELDSLPEGDISDPVGFLIR